MSSCKCEEDVHFQHFPNNIIFLFHFDVIHLCFLYSEDLFTDKHEFQAFNFQKPECVPCSAEMRINAELLQSGS